MNFDNSKRTILEEFFNKKRWFICDILMELHDFLFMCVRSEVKKLFKELFACSNIKNDLFLISYQFKFQKIFKSNFLVWIRFWICGWCSFHLHALYTIFFVQNLWINSQERYSHSCDQKKLKAANNLQVAFYKICYYLEHS